MAEERTTLAELLKFNDVSLADLNVSDLVLGGTMWAELFAQPSSNGTVHKYFKEITAPVIGFRLPNESKTHQPGTKEQVIVDLKILEATAEEDKAIAEANIKGADYHMAMRAMENLRVAFHNTDRQFIYGTAADAKGFTGLAEASGLDALADEKVVDGGGSGSDVESIWIMRTAENGVSSIFNGDNDGLQIGDIYEQQLNEYNGSGLAIGTFSGLVAPILSWLGMQIGSKHDVVRIANVDTTSNDVEDLIQDGLSLFPSGKGANKIFCSRRARRAVTRGRQKTATENKRVPTATEVDEVPLYISEGLVPETAIA